MTASVEAILGRMILRFTSNTDIDVDRAHITRREWWILERYIRSLPRER